MAQITEPKLPSLKVGSSKYKGNTYYYVQTYTFHYDPKTKHSIRDSQKTVGTIKGGNKYGEIEFKQEFIDEYPDLNSFRTYKTENGIEFKLIDDELDVVTKALKVKKLIGGATWAIDKAISQIGIGDALRSTFGQYKRHLKLASIINYMIQQRTCVMHNYEPFAKSHWLPWSRPLNDAQIHHLFKNITEDDIFRFFNALNRGYRDKFGEQFFKRLFVALDSTSISNYSKELSLADMGHNKDGDFLKQINYLMVCDEISGSLIYGKTYKGNVVDVSTIKNLLADLKCIFKYDGDDDFSPNLVFVTDRGYDSNDNLQDFLKHGFNFVMRAARLELDTRVSSTIDKHIDELKDFNNFDTYVEQYVYTAKVEYKYDDYPIQDKNKNNTTKVDTYVHMYYDPKIYNQQRDNIVFNINLARNSYNQRVQDFYNENGSASVEDLGKIDIGKMQSFIRHYCSFDAKGFAVINSDKVHKKLKYCGVMALVSDCLSDPKEALFAYMNRQRVERNFETHKSILRFNRPYSSNDKSFQGKFLCEMLATAVSIYFETNLKNYEKTPDAAKDNIIINSSSMSKIIDELNTIMLVSLKNGFYFDEVQGKYRHLYKALGVPVPESLYKYESECNEKVEDEEPYEKPDEELMQIGGELM